MFRDHTPLQDIDWFPDVDALQMAFNLANLFNGAYQDTTGVEITFATPYLYKLTDLGRANGICPKRLKGQLDEIVCVESFLEGKFIKVNANNGWFHKSRDYEFNVAHAFSHWTWHASGGSFLVCDLQGVKSCN